MRTAVYLVLALFFAAAAVLMTRCGFDVSSGALPVAEFAIPSDVVDSRKFMISVFSILAANSYLIAIACLCLARPASTRAH